MGALGEGLSAAYSWASGKAAPTMPIHQATANRGTHPGSLVQGDVVGTAHVPTAAERESDAAEAAYNADQRRKGFIDSMGGWAGAPFLRKDTPFSPTPPPPPASGWAYQPGKGTMWSSPQQTGSSGNYVMNFGMPGPGTGNRI